RGGRQMPVLTAHASAENLRELGAMAAAGTLRPSIERRFPFAEMPAAVALLETLRVRGKVVVANLQ
ncbi:MAG: zinc-binding dehydrogenase, partial [Bauldia sp.]|nr:zinc-binding dehydrogenase [Bauldia sp.]